MPNDTPIEAKTEGKPSSVQSAYREFIRILWGEPPIATDGGVVQIERAICAIRGFSILGLAAVIAYGGLAGYCASHCGESGTFLGMLRGITVALLAAIAAFSVGGMLGFLFGLPRWGDSAPASVPQQQEQQTVAEKKDDKAADGTAPGADAKPAATPARPASADARVTAEQGGRSRVRPNTGLEKVMDWLTTLIVGLGLVHLQSAIAYAKSISGWVTAAIVGERATDGAVNFTGGAAVLLPYLIAGFFLVYLWAQRYMGREMLLADLESNSLTIQIRKEVKGLQEEVRTKVTTEVKSAKDQAWKDNLRTTTDILNLVAPVMKWMTASTGKRADADAPAPALPKIVSGDEALAGLEKPVADGIRARFEAAKDWNDEPARDFGPQESRGRKLEATVESLAGSEFAFRVTLTVRSSVPDVPLEGDVVFLLHHTLPDSIRRVPVVEGVATTDVESIGAFIAGAYLVKEKIGLSFDLATLPDTPQAFKDN